MFTMGPSLWGGLVGLEAFPFGLKSVRALKRKITGYSGNCIRVRRSSDNAEQDIGFTTSAIDAPVDSAAAVAFAGAGSAFVTTIYDQSGNGDSMVQATSAKQPRVVNAGVWDGFVRFDGTDDSMQSTNNSGAVSTYNAAVLLSLRSAGTAGRIILERGVNLGGNANNETALSTGSLSGNGVVAVFKSESANYFGSVYLLSTKTPNGTDANWATMSYASSGSAGLEWWRGSTKYTLDGTSVVGTVGTGVVGTAIKWYLGARNNASFFCDLNWYADAIYEGAVPDATKIAIQLILQR
jgi:hypothetical protein